MSPSPSLTLELIAGMAVVALLSGLAVDGILLVLLPLLLIIYLGCSFGTALDLNLSLSVDLSSGTSLSFTFRFDLDV